MTAGIIEAHADFGNSTEAQHNPTEATGRVTILMEMHYRRLVIWPPVILYCSGVCSGAPVRRVGGLGTQPLSQSALGAAAQPADVGAQRPDGH